MWGPKRGLKSLPLLGAVLGTVWGVLGVIVGSIWVPFRGPFGDAFPIAFSEVVRGRLASQAGGSGEVQERFRRGLGEVEGRMAKVFADWRERRELARPASHCPHMARVIGEAVRRRLRTGGRVRL